MANTYKNKTLRATGVTATAIGGYTVPAATSAIVVGLTLANILTTVITVTVSITDICANVTNIVKQSSIPVGGTLVLVGGEQKLVLMTGDVVKVTSSDAAAVDTIMSILEIA